jgi:hypothetical protein
MHVRRLVIDGLSRRDVATPTRVGERVLAAIDGQQAQGTIARSATARR